jgi:hypothetical protein
MGPLAGCHPLAVIDLPRDRQPVASGFQRPTILAVGGEVQGEGGEGIRLARAPASLARQRKRFLPLG